MTSFVSRAVGPAFALLVWALPLTGQVTLAEAEVQYRQAVAQLEANREEYQRVFSLYEQASDRVVGARARGDDNARDREFAAFQARGNEVLELERAEAALSDAVDQARAVYLTALASREEEILGQLGAATSFPVLTALLEAAREIQDRVTELEAEAFTEPIPTFRPVPELVVDDRDSLEDVVAKGNLLVERAASYDANILVLEVQVEVLQRRLQRTQSLEQIRRDVARFGPDLLPGAPQAPPPAPDATDGGAGATGDGTGGLDPTTDMRQLEDRIAEIRDNIDLARRYRDEALARAELFRATAESMAR